MFNNIFIDIFVVFLGLYVFNKFFIAFINMIVDKFRNLEE